MTERAQKSAVDEANLPCLRNVPLRAASRRTPRRFSDARALILAFLSFGPNGDARRADGISPPAAATAMALPRRPNRPGRRRDKNAPHRGVGGVYSDSLGRRTRSGFPPGRGYEGQLFTVRQVLPPLDITALAAQPGGANNGTALGGTHYVGITQGHWPISTDECVPHVCGPLPVVYTNDPRRVERWLGEHVPASASALGFDVESVPGVPWMKGQVKFEGPATIQLSTPHSSLVVHLTRAWGDRRSTACPAIEALLKDETIIKAGAGIDEDMLELHRWNRRLVARSRFDLGGIGSTPTFRRVGLKRLVRAVLGVELRKSKKLAVSNWSRVPLTNSQLAYCARDAWAGAAVLHDLAERDPDQFGTDALRSLLRRERSVNELNERASERKRAKEELKEIFHQLKLYAEIEEGTRSLKDMMPPLVKKEVARLQDVIDETAPDGLITFDTKPLGLLLNV